MSIERPTSLGLVTPDADPARAGSARVDRPRTEAERQRLAEAALQFEAMFLLQMLKQMRQSMLADEDEEPGLGSATMLDTVDAELARYLAGQQNGLAPMLMQSMEKAAGVDAPAAAPSPAIATPASVAPLSEPTPSTSADAGTSAPVSSPFGWRRDPFTGATRFHAGIDLKTSYGREVAAAGAGRVVEAGEAGGYGQTVVLEHAPGLRTRYAHLSSVTVKVGDSVTAGAMVGRVGQSGRATGPHLHFEVLQDGRPVDPESAGARLASVLKDSSTAADYPSGQAGLSAGPAGADQ